MLGRGNYTNNPSFQYTYSSDEYTSILQTQVHKEKSEPELNSTGADSDIDMEDDITHPDEAGKSCLSNNTNVERVSIPQAPFMASAFQYQRGADDSGMRETGRNEHTVYVSVKESAQGFASNSTSEKNDAENILGDVIPPSINDESINKHRLSKPAAEYPKTVREAEKSSRIVDEFSDKRRRGKDSVSDGSLVAFQSKGLSRNCVANIGLDGANFHKPDTKSNSTKPNLDEFGRLVKEHASDSDTSNSPHYTRKHERRAIKRNTRQSRSRSRSPHRRRRSPSRRKERRRRSRSSSPVRRRSRSRSPVSRRDSEFSGDKRRLEKGQLVPECLDFFRGKCHRGAACRYSHHESDKGERSRHNRGKQHTLSSSDFHVESKVFSDNELKNKWSKLPHGLKEVEDAKEPTVDSTAYSPDKSNSLKPGSLLANCAVRDFHDTPSVKQDSVVLEPPSQYSDDNTPQIIDQQGTRIDDSLITDSATEQVPSQSLKEFPPSVANHPSELALPLPPVSQVTSALFPQTITQDYNTMLPFSRFQSASETFSLHQPPVFYQHSQFSVPSNSFLPPPPPPHSHLGDEVTTREHSVLSQHIQQPILQAAEMANRSQNGQYQAYPLTWAPNQMVHTTDNFGASNLHVSNLTNRHMIGGEQLTSYTVQGMGPSQSFAQVKPYSLLSQSPSKRVHSSLVGGLPPDSNSSHGLPYYQQTFIPAQLAQPANVSKPDFLDGNRPSYAHDFVGSKILNHFNPYASSSTFNLPLNTKFSSNSEYNAPVEFSSVPEHKVASVGSETMVSSSLLPRPGGGQYDPLFDSIEPTSNSSTRPEHNKQHENTGDQRAALSVSDSLENEEYGETADAEVGAVLNTDETEIDQVKVSGKKKKVVKDSRSINSFKISIAAFVKEVLKPSWREGNMSKEAFKTIVKKTVDKVSGAMRSHHIPKSQTKINHYIDSSRGKLTKLVMGYVDKYVKV